MYHSVYPTTHHPLHLFSISQRERERERDVCLSGGDEVAQRSLGNIKIKYLSGNCLKYSDGWRWLSKHHSIVRTVSLSQQSKTTINFEGVKPLLLLQSFETDWRAGTGKFPWELLVTMTNLASVHQHNTCWAAKTISCWIKC